MTGLMSSEKQGNAYLSIRNDEQSRIRLLADSPKGEGQQRKKSFVNPDTKMKHERLNGGFRIMSHGGNAAHLK
ncbi:hypothetical protein SAMN05216308_105118 [Nitrosospira sp. Nsp13]|nr:hypothetical protein SAMN05216308_105118 [Nitrosospira sp. Nsp13]